MDDFLSAVTDCPGLRSLCVFLVVYVFGERCVSVDDGKLSRQS